MAGKSSATASTSVSSVDILVQSAGCLGRTENLGQTRGHFDRQLGGAGSGGIGSQLQPWAKLHLTRTQRLSALLRPAQMLRPRHR